MRRRIRLIGTSALLSGLLLSAGTACGSDDPEPVGAPSASTTPPGSPAPSPTGSAPATPAPTGGTSQGTPPAGGAGQGTSGLQPVLGRWDYLDKKTGRTFSLFISPDGSVRSQEPGERNSVGTIVSMGNGTFQLRPRDERRGANKPADMRLSPDGKTLTVSLEGESFVYTKAG